RVYDCFVDDDGSICVAMELVPGGTLRELILRSGPLAQGLALSVLYQILDALEAIHKAGIVHRDIKPRNILLTNDDDGNLLVKVSDFGHAAKIGSKTNLTLSKFIGTAPYAAPEQGIHGSICNARSDIFAAVTVFLALLNGQVYDDAPVHIPIP